MTRLSCQGWGKSSGLQHLTREEWHSSDTHLDWLRASTNRLVLSACPASVQRLQTSPPFVPCLFLALLSPTRGPSKNGAVRRDRRLQEEPGTDCIFLCQRLVGAAGAAEERGGRAAAGARLPLWSARGGRAGERWGIGRDCTVCPAAYASQARHLLPRLHGSRRWPCSFPPWPQAPLHLCSGGHSQPTRPTPEPPQEYPSCPVIHFLLPLPLPASTSSTLVCRGQRIAAGD